MQGLSRIHEAWLTRNQVFRSLAMRSLFSITLGGAVGIVLASSGYGVLALVGQLVTTSLVSLVSLWTLTPWRPVSALVEVTLPNWSAMAAMLRSQASQELRQRQFRPDLCHLVYGGGGRRPL